MPVSSVGHCQCCRGSGTGAVPSCTECTVRECTGMVNVGSTDGAVRRKKYLVNTDFADRQTFAGAPPSVKTVGLVST